VVCTDISSLPLHDALPIFKTVERFDRLLLVGCVVALLVVFIPGLGSSVNGAQRWINLGVSKFQAVEAVKVMYIVWLASYLVRFRDRKSTRLNSSHVKISYA